MHYFSFALFTCALGWLMLAAKTRRRIVAVTVAGVLVSTLVIAPPPPRRRPNHPRHSSSAQCDQWRDTDRPECNQHHQSRNEQLVPEPDLAGAVDQPGHGPSFR